MEPQLAHFLEILPITTMPTPKIEAFEGKVSLDMIEDRAIIRVDSGEVKIKATQIKDVIDYLKACIEQFGTQ